MALAQNRLPNRVGVGTSDARKASLRAFVRDAWPRVAARGLWYDTTALCFAVRAAWQDEAGSAKALGLYAMSTSSGDIAAALHRIARRLHDVGELAPKEPPCG